MNVNQTKKYGALLKTYTDTIRRYCDCPHCSFRAARARFGRGNALAASAVVRGDVMRHIREKHPETVKL